MTNELRVLIEEPPKGTRWVAIAADWPGLERNGKSADDAVAKLTSYLPSYLKVAQRAALGTDFERATRPTIVGRHTGTGSTDFWGISFAPSYEDRDYRDDVHAAARSRACRPRRPGGALDGQTAAWRPLTS